MGSQNSVIREIVTLKIRYTCVGTRTFGELQSNWILLRNEYIICTLAHFNTVGNSMFQWKQLQAPHYYHSLVSLPLCHFLQFNLQQH